MNKAPGVLIASQIANPKVQRSRPAPRLRLLIELEPRHRVFFRNLADLLLSRRVPQIPITARPARFWDDVFVPSRPPWSSFLESMLLHVLVTVLFIWGQSRVWVSVKLFPQRDTFHSSITYYPPARTFRAAESRASSAHARLRAKPESPQQAAHQKAISVTPEQKRSIVAPPDIKQATARLPNLPAAHPVAPIVPFSSTAGLRRNALAGPSGVVAPPPQLNKDIDQATARRLALPQSSAVAPAPELAGRSAGRVMETPNTGGSRVVPPPPTAGNSASARQLSSLSGTGPNVVPPPPSVQAADKAARLGSLSGTGPNVVPPPPSVQAAGKATRSGSWADGSSPVVPPPPSVENAGKSGTAKRFGSFSGDGAQIVPPPPSVESSRNSGAGGRFGSLSGHGSGDDSQFAPPPSADSGLRNYGGGGTGKVLAPMDPLPVDASSPTPAVNNENEATIEELPLGLLGVVFAAPGSSFFSNFEVFVAKRRIGKDHLQLIKLVYEFLPYQRRLSEYNLNNLPLRVIKLRVTPDPTCDEPLGQIIQPRSDPTSPDVEHAKLPPTLRSADLNAVLPCYRTTAGDFQKAMLRAH